MNFNPKQVVTCAQLQLHVLNIYLFMLTTIVVASSNDVRTGVHRLFFHPDNSAAVVRVRIIDDELVEGSEAFGVRLIVPDHHKVNGVKLGKLSLAKVVIKDGMFFIQYKLFL